MAVCYEIVYNLVGSLFIIKTYVGKVLKPFKTVGVNAYDGLFIFLADSYAVVVQHSEKDKSVDVPGGDMPHDLVRVTGYIQHHEVSGISDGLFDTAYQYGYKRVHDKVFILIGSGLQGKTYDLGFILCKITCIDIGHVVYLLQKLLNLFSCVSRNLA